MERGKLLSGQNGRAEWTFAADGFSLFSLVNAGIAQLVEQLICNQQVVGSNPTAGSSNLRFPTPNFFACSRLNVGVADFRLG
jgi:hypothetical protein